MFSPVVKWSKMVSKVSEGIDESGKSETTTSQGGEGRGRRGNPSQSVFSLTSLWSAKTGGPGYRIGRKQRCTILSCSACPVEDVDNVADERIDRAQPTARWSRVPALFTFFPHAVPLFPVSPLTPTRKGYTRLRPVHYASRCRWTTTTRRSILLLASYARSHASGRKWYKL